MFFYVTLSLYAFDIFYYLFFFCTEKLVKVCYNYIWNLCKLYWHTALSYHTFITFNRFLNTDQRIENEGIWILFFAVRYYIHIYMYVYSWYVQWENELAAKLSHDQSTFHYWKFCVIDKNYSLLFYHIYTFIYVYKYICMYIYIIWNNVTVGILVFFPFF